MNLTISMPYSYIRLTDGDNHAGFKQLQKALTMTVRKFNGRETSFDYVCLLEGDGRFRTGLLERIQMLAPSLGLRIETVTDQRKAPFGIPMEYDGTLRDYQEETVNTLMTRYMGTISMGTGAGKTNIAAALIARFGLKTLFLVHTIDLLEQAKERIESVLHKKVGMIGDGRYDVQDITVATIQTLIGQPVDPNFFKMVICDEGHRCPADTYYTVTERLNAQRIYAFSATPYRKDGNDMMIEAVAGPVIVDVTASDLIEKGWLMKPEPIFFNVAQEKSTSSAPRHAVIKKYIVENKLRNQMIIDLAKKSLEEGLSTVIAVDQIKHLDILKDALSEAVALNGKSSSETRNKVLEGFRDGKVKLVIGTILDEGIDLPKLECLINAAGGTDPMQLIGRILRKHEGKKTARYIDFIDNGHSSLLSASKARMKRLKQERAFEVKII